MAWHRDSMKIHVKNTSTSLVPTPIVKIVIYHVLFGMADLRCWMLDFGVGDCCAVPVLPVVLVVAAVLALLWLLNLSCLFLAGSPGVGRGGLGGGS